MLLISSLETVELPPRGWGFHGDLARCRGAAQRGQPRSDRHDRHRPVPRLLWRGVRLDRGPRGPAGPGMRLSFVSIGAGRELNVFEVEGGATPPHRPMLGRGPIDHLGLQAMSIDAFDEIRRRLMARGATDGSSPTSARSTACSSSIPTDSSARYACRTRRPSPASSNPPGRAPATKSASRSGSGRRL